MRRCFLGHGDFSERYVGNAVLCKSADRDDKYVLSERCAYKLQEEKWNERFRGGSVRALHGYELPGRALSFAIGMRSCDSTADHDHPPEPTAGFKRSIDSEPALPHTILTRHIEHRVTGPPKPWRSQAHVHSTPFS